MTKVPLSAAETSFMLNLNTAPQTYSSMATPMVLKIVGSCERNLSLAYLGSGSVIPLSEHQFCFCKMGLITSAADSLGSSNESMPQKHFSVNFSSDNGIEGYAVSVCLLATISLGTVACPSQKSQVTFHKLS